MDINLEDKQNEELQNICNIIEKEHSKELEKVFQEANTLVSSPFYSKSEGVKGLDVGEIYDFLG